MAYGLGFFVLFILVMPWQQTASGEGRVLAFAPGERIQTLTTSVDGRIKKWIVHEGAVVKSGDLIAEVEDNDPEILERIRHEREAVKRKLTAIEMSLRAAQSDLDRQDKLFKEGVVSQRTAEQARINVARFLNEKATSEAELARLDVRLSRQNMQQIRSTADGIIKRILVGENFELLKAGDPIASIVPDTEARVVELKVEGKDLPFIGLGQRVQVQFEGWPILQFSGLPELSIGTFWGELQLIDPADDGAGNFRVIVKAAEGSVWPKSDFLRQGVRARGWIQMNRVPLWFEIWRNLMSLPPGTIPADRYVQKTSPKAKSDSLEQQEK
jgi:multidrug efflux pump subunit AcrA (membrane-fusion protein)